MWREDTHCSDQELVRAIDGDLSPRRRKHLSRCWPCRARLSETEQAIAEFVRQRERDWNSRLPPLEAPRALLRARLAGLAAEPDSSLRRRRFSLALTYAVTAALVVVLAVGLDWLSGMAEAVAKPKHQLTPGATVPLTRNDLCGHDSSLHAPSPSPVLQRQIFEEYGISNARPDAYEVDYLITPELGGATSIRNLWPQPYNTKWNARVKDQLEERLRSLVCGGQIDLATAQKEIASDWISAYKKYFHTDRPLFDRPKALNGKPLPEAQILAMYRQEPTPNRFQIPPMEP